MQLQDEKKLFWDAGNAHTFNGRQIGTSDYGLAGARLLRLSNRKIHRKQQRLGGTSIAIAEVCL
jgi:hypothetical protein